MEINLFYEGCFVCVEVGFGILSWVIRFLLFFLKLENMFFVVFGDV